MNELLNSEYLEKVYLGNTIKSYLTCIVILLIGFVLRGIVARALSWFSFKFFQKFSHQKFQKEFNTLVHKPFMQLVMVIILYWAFHNLSFPDYWNFGPKHEFGVRWIIHAVYKIILIVVITRLFLRGADFVELVYHHSEYEAVSNDLASFIKNLAKVFIYILSFFIILAEAFEVNITAVVTSLGIGGLAIALAAQDTLANLIGSFIIYLDKPFKVGDLVDFSDIRGTVEKIGFRTTRIRTLDRSLLLVPNKKIIDSNLINISLSTQRRVRFLIGLTYSSKPEDIQNIIEEIRAEILSHQPLVAEDVTVKFSDFDTSSLSLLVIFFVNSIDFDVMISVKEKVNIAIMEIVRRNGCDFAFPTQTIHLESHISQ
ncbi:MAG: mechanosensitive ion channel family protein [Bacteroidia bacterium]